MLQAGFFGLLVKWTVTVAVLRSFPLIDIDSTTSAVTVGNDPALDFGSSETFGSFRVMFAVISESTEAIGAPSGSNIKPRCRINTCVPVAPAADTLSTVIAFADDDSGTKPR